MLTDSFLSSRFIRIADDKFTHGLFEWPTSQGVRLLPSNEKAFVCGECGRSYNYQKSLIKHQKYECGMEPQFPCPFCAHRCKQKIHLVKHVHGNFSLGGLEWPVTKGTRLLSSNEKAFVCGECGRCYNLQKSLIKHQKYECGIEPQFPCPYCTHRCKHKIHLVKHVRRIHHTELPRM
ncbi:hypothetical protein FOCC_FOCC005458 [Frankliniella occidentalis]|nr:hypothetical protein FOCC_FOCC005458 [Frankliniella occidentalis]